jgi:DNA-binding beta-propeller fold protein YncE
MEMKPTRRDLLWLAGALMAPKGVRAEVPAGNVVAFVGDGSRPGMAAERDVAAAAHINNPYGLIEPADRSALYWVDNGSNRVLKLDYATRKISIVAGTGTRGFAGDGGPADKAQFNQPHSIALDPAGNLYVCDLLNNRVRRVDAKTGIVTTFAGNGEKGRTPDDGPLTETPIEGPRSLEITRAGKIYLALREGNAVFELDVKSGRLKRVAGTGEKGYTGDGGPAVKATFGSSGAGSGLTGPKGLTVTEDGRTMYVADCENHAIRKVDLRNGTISTVAGTGKKGDGPDGAPLECALNRPHGVYVRDKVLYIGDSENNRIRTLTPA